MSGLPSDCKKDVHFQVGYSLLVLIYAQKDGAILLCCLAPGEINKKRSTFKVREVVRIS